MVFYIKVSGLRAGKPETRLFAVSANETDYTSAAKTALCEAESGEKPLKEAKVLSIKTTNVHGIILYSGSEYDVYTMYVAKITTDTGDFEIIVEATDIEGAVNALKLDGIDISSIVSIKAEKLAAYIASQEEAVELQVKHWEDEKRREREGLFPGISVKRVS